MTMDYGTLVHEDRVHGSVYVNPEVFRQEMHRIYHQGWVFVAHDSELPEPGDWVTRRLGLENYILTRDLKGRLNLLANRCAHRGTALCWRERGHDRQFKCTYHGWTYALDGELKGVSYPGGFDKDKRELGLDRAGQLDVYRGFIFANPSGTAGTLADHLGPGGKYLIDRMCDLSPTGSIRVAPNWIGQRIDSNWKMWPESDNDGYHLNFVHISLFTANESSQYEDTMLGGEHGNMSRAVDHGGGHIELDLSPSYPHPLAWINTTPDKQPEYRDALIEAYGQERAEALMQKGPPHGLVFPNLFLGEINVARVEPIAPNLTLHHHTAMQMENAGEAINQRLMRMSEAAMGPASFLLADDAVTAERIQSSLGGADPAMAAGEEHRAWLDMSRGRHRDVQETALRRAGALSDETTYRGFWRHYRHVMERGA